MFQESTGVERAGEMCVNVCYTYFSLSLTHTTLTHCFLAHALISSGLLGILELLGLLRLSLGQGVVII
jgi:hypothetical protein